MYINWNQFQTWNFSAKRELGRVYAHQKGDPQRMRLLPAATEQVTARSISHTHTHGLLQDQRHLRTAGTLGSEAFRMQTITKVKSRRQYAQRDRCIESCCGFA